MRTRFIFVWAVLALLLCAGAWAQAGSAALTHIKGIDPALLAKANAGDAEAQYQLGNAYNYGGKVRRDYAQALVWYRKGAEQGNADAQFQLGRLYHFGLGVPKDEAQAFAWTIKAAEQGKADAEYFISGSYFLGRGVAVDNAHGYFWLRRAAEDGDPDSQYMLGWMYEDGPNGSHWDYGETYFWLDVAAADAVSRKTRQDALKRRDEVASHLTPAELASEQARAHQWLQDHPAQSQ